MDTVVAGRTLVADTLGLHLLFVVFGVGLPVLISGLELFGIITHRPTARAIAHTWSRILVILFIAGAISGTIVSLQFSLLWPRFMAFAGKVVGVSFALEGFAFLVEALFLSIYMLSWKRFQPIWHWLCSIPVVLGALASAFFITTVNAFMNTPQGFDLNAQGQPININTWKAVFNPAAGTEISHSILAYIFTTILCMAAVYAWLLWRSRLSGEARQQARQLLVGLAGLAVVFGLLVGFAGDQSGKFLARSEPAKLAAAEVLPTTQSHAPLIIGGLVSGGTVHHGLKLPGLLSFLATGSTHGTVRGLDQVLPSDRPPLYIHYFFDIMVGIGTLTTIIPLGYLLLERFRFRWSERPITLLALMGCGVLALVAAECGWMLTEFGRQPYVIRGILLTKDALTQSQAIIHFAYIFPTFYLILIAATVWTLKRAVNSQELLP